MHCTGVETRTCSWLWDTRGRDHLILMCYKFFILSYVSILSSLWDIRKYTWVRRVKTNRPYWLNRDSKCTFLPPKRLYHPVLPFLYNNKILICVKRARLNARSVTSCSRFSKCTNTKWRQYDSRTCVDGLFMDYIKTFLKSKAEASGYPNWVRSP